MSARPQSDGAARNAPTVGSLFAGIGGFDLGFQRAGFEIAWQVEIDPYCRKVLERHFPHAERFNDVRECGAHNLKPVDVICGGFPCQDISVAGKGAGIEGERSGLWGEYARIIGELRPRFVVVENVAALLGRGLGRVLGDLAEIGYDAEWEIISAADVGAPHLRERVWIVAYAMQRGGCSEHGQQQGERAAGSDSGCKGELGNSSIAGFSVRTGEPMGQPGQNSQSERPDCQVADASRARREEFHTAAIADGSGYSAGSLDAYRSFWALEPNVGGSFDGLSGWMDGFSGLSESHNLLLSYGASTQTGTGEIVRILRNFIEQEELQWQAGGLVGIHPTKVLLAYLCKLQARFADEARVQVEGQEAFEEIMRGMWGAYKPARPPHRSEQAEQLAGKHSDALQVLSRLLARHAEKAWVVYRRSDACPVLGWETGIARVADGVPKRVDRLKALGNAVVPQIPELIARRLLEAW